LDHRQVHDSATPSRAIPGLAGIPETARIEYTGLRILLRSNHLVSDAVRLFVVRHANREILHAAATPYPTAEWAAQQTVECCAWDRWPPRFLIHDRDSGYGATSERLLRQLGIKQCERLSGCLEQMRFPSVG